MAPVKAEAMPNAAAAEKVVEKVKEEEDAMAQVGGRDTPTERHISSPATTTTTIITTLPPIPLPNTVDSLRGLSGALSEFVHRWDALQRALDSIHDSIDARFHHLDALDSPTSAAEESMAPTDGPHKPELELICETMGGHSLRKYMVAHLSDLDHLRADVPAALLRAPNPARLVLEAMGRFYKQSSKAYAHNPPAIATRQACLLLLELFLLSGSTSDPSIAKAARVAAFAWRTRLVDEGGVRSASATDAFGLTLFLASFGIPHDFSLRDLSYLLYLSCRMEKADILRHSAILLTKIPDIIKDMKAANRKQLTMLKSIIKCVEDNNLDLSKLASFNIHQRIAKLEKLTINAEEKLKGNAMKRKFEDVGPLIKPEDHATYPWPASADAFCLTPLQMNMQTPGEGSSVLSGVKSCYKGLLPLPQNMHDCGSSGSVDRHGGTRQTAAPVHGTSALAAAGCGLPFVDVGGNMYGWHEDEALTGASMGFKLLGVAPVGVQSLTGPPMGKSLVDPSQTAEQNSCQPLPTLPLGMGSRSSGYDLYQFADTVLEEEPYMNTSSQAVLPTTLGTTNNRTWVEVAVTSSHVL